MNIRSVCCFGLRAASSAVPRVLVAAPQVFALSPSRPTFPAGLPGVHPSFSPHPSPQQHQQLDARQLAALTRRDGRSWHVPSGYPAVPLRRS